MFKQQPGIIINKIKGFTQANPNTRAVVDSVFGFFYIE